MLPTGLCAQLACIWEATARKPGNVHRFHDFDDTSYLDFLASAIAMAPVLESAHQRCVGETVLEGVRATRRLTQTNTNLGILLLLAPLATIPVEQELRSGLDGVLGSLDVSDARAVYEAIRLANPAGLGRVPEQDIHDEPTEDLRQVMCRAAEHDLVARQYVNGFHDVFEGGVPALVRGLERAQSLEGAIILCHLHLLATHRDSLIVRKRGISEAEEAGRRAGKVLESDWPASRTGWAALAELDAWLRAEGHSRNPGTSADLVTACLFVVLRQGTMIVPSRFPWSAGFDHG